MEFLIAVCRQACLVTTTLTMLLATVDASEFINIGGFENDSGIIRSGVRFMADDGSLVLGQTYGGGPKWKWTPTSGLEEFDEPDAPAGYDRVFFDGMSRDGSRAVVRAIDFEDKTHLLLWNPEDGFETFGNYPSGFSQHRITDLSADGSAVLGESFDGPPFGFHQGWLWSEETGLTLLPNPPAFPDPPLADLADLSHGFRPNGMSGDGKLIIGNPLVYGSDSARIWDFETGQTTILPIPDIGQQAAFGNEPHWNGTYVSQISDDGAVVTGAASAGLIGETNLSFPSIVWQHEQDPLVLDFLPAYGHDTLSLLRLSADGKVVTGVSSNRAADGPTTDERAVVWTNRDGLKELQVVLREEYGLETHAWGLSTVQEMSADRRVLSSYSYEDRSLNSASAREAWIIKLDWPLGSIRGDATSDDVLDAADADILVAEIIAGTSDPMFDLDGNGTVEFGDLSNYLVRANHINGDADFDGEVAFADFLTLSGNFGDLAPWSGGDFDANGSVQFADFLILSGNFGVSGPTAATVPEPSAMLMLVIALVVGQSTRRSRSDVPSTFETKLLLRNVLRRMTS